MSRKINMADPSSWSTEDIRYLNDRGRLPKDQPAQDQTVAVIDSNDEPESEYQWLNMTSLKKLLKDRGLSTAGSKDDLINRLEEDDSQIITEE